MNHLKQWWTLHSAWITTVLYFLVPSVQAWINAHPKTVAASIVGTVLAALLQKSPAQKVLPAIFLAVALTASCNTSQVQAYINLAVQIALQVATLAGAPPSAAARVSSDLASVNKLISDYNAADSLTKTSKLQQIDSLLSVAESDVTDIANVASIKDPKVLQDIKSALSIAVTAIESIRSLEIKGTPTNAARVTASVALPGAVAPKPLLASPKQLKNLYNMTVSNYPGAKLQ